MTPFAAILSPTVIEPAPALVGVDCRYARLAELAEELSQPASAWLSPRECGQLQRYRDSGRRRAWLAGRLLAKQLVRAQLGTHVALSRIEVLAPGGRERPQAYCDGVAQPWPLSISHTDHGVLVALGHARHLRIGVDLTPCQARSSQFLRLWFTTAELAWIRQENEAARTAYLWAAKEALYKAVNDGEGFDPRQCEVLPGTRCRYQQQLRTDVALQSCNIDGQIAVLVRLPRTAHVKSFATNSEIDAIIATATR